MYIAYSLPSFLKTKMISIFAQVSELIDFPKPLIAAVNGPTVSYRALYLMFLANILDNESPSHCFASQCIAMNDVVILKVGIMFTTLPLFDLVFASTSATFSAPFTRLGQARLNTSQ